MSRWHPREHRRALEGMLILTLEERGAYNTCLDLIYDREGPIPDDARWLAGWMGISTRRWSTIRASLIMKGKIFALVVNGEPVLMNRRAAIELENQSKISRERVENGAKGGRTHAETKANLSENNAPGQAEVKPVRASTLTSTETEEREPTKPNGLSPPFENAKGSRLPDLWQPMPLPPGPGFVISADQWAVELDKFRDYWRAVPGAKGRKLDWDATWRNWIRRNFENGKANARNTPTAKLAARYENYAASDAGFNRAVGRDRDL